MFLAGKNHHQKMKLFAVEHVNCDYTIFTEITRMKTISISVLLALCLLFTGCPVRTLSPLFLSEDAVFNPALIGTWGNEEASERMEFQRSGEKNYRVVFREKNGDTTAYAVQLGRLGDVWFLDAYPAAKNQDYQLLPTHTIWRIELGEDTIRTAAFEGDWLKEMLDNKTVDTPHGNHDGDIILTGSTEELQGLVLRSAHDDKAFPNPGTFIRVK
jgi:hypothetical protein